MSTAEAIEECEEEEYENLTQDMTWEEQKALVSRIAQASMRGDHALADSLSKHVPILPGMAKLMYEWEGKEYCERYFNLSEANKAFGKGWMDG